MEIIRYTDSGAKEKIFRLFNREKADPKVSERVRAILEKVRTTGDLAISELTQQLDKTLITPGRSKVTEHEVTLALQGVSTSFRRSFEETRNNIHKYYEPQKRSDYRLENEEGFALETLFLPIETIGVYIPGGTAPLVSTVLMTIVPAQIAGVKGIIVCTPPNEEAKIHPYILGACSLLGVKDVFKVGGAQAIAAMAYGTETIPKVDKIFGPGNVYVTEAKSQVFGQVGIDLLAGPSEIVIVADRTANADYLAADLISQAEHDTASKSVLITDSLKIVGEVKSKIYKQLETLPRKAIAAQSIEKFCVMVLVADLDIGMEIANLLAPEHLEIITEQPRKWLGKVRHAGTVLLGEYSPAVVGDFVAGPSHVLPTNRSARAFSGIHLDDYLKKTNVIEFSAKGLKRFAPVLKDFSSVEGLTGHYRSAEIRLEQRPTKKVKGIA